VYARGALALAIAFCAPLAGCSRDEPPRLAPALDVRPVRVLLFDGGVCRVRTSGAYRVYDAGGVVHMQGDELDWTRVASAGGIRIGESETHPGPLLLESDELVQLAPVDREDDAPTQWYSGALELSARADGLRVINHVDIEAYVAGVVAQEAWPTFHDEALKAQAVAARTYAMYIMSERDTRPFDLRAGEGDQVYRGVRRDAFGARTAAAADATRGVVLSTLTDEGLRIFCAYYAAACGGRSQGLVDYQGGGAPDAAPLPLRGGVACDYCRIAKGDAYRWGPHRVPKAELLVRLQERDRSFADWEMLASVAVTDKTEFGRVRQLTLTSGDGRAALMGAEHFRLAVGSGIMRSTDCTLTDAGAELLLEDGRGFGHGLGMCQWGAEGQARAGRRAGKVLLHYYPGAQLVRAY
jgi:stage II sporulation protein D